jgi:hypothetical protein
MVGASKTAIERLACAGSPIIRPHVSILVEDDPSMAIVEPVVKRAGGKRLSVLATRDSTINDSIVTGEFISDKHFFSILVITIVTSYVSDRGVPQKADDNTDRHDISMNCTSAVDTDQSAEMEAGGDVLAPITTPLDQLNGDVVCALAATEDAGTAVTRRLVGT